MNPAIATIFVAIFASSVLGFDYDDDCCPDPYDVPYGYISHGRRSRYVYGSVVVYGCNSGYKLWGNNKIRCLKRGYKYYWDGHRPVCKKIYGDDYNDCGHLDDPDYGHCKIYGSTATYSCNDGYDLWGGDRVRKCNHGYWGGKAPSCRRKHKRCDNPHDPDYGYCKVYDDTATYYCNDGYELWGGDRVRKCKDGYWGGKSPSCRRKHKRCDNPHDPDYGYCKVYDDTATYYCNDGYELWGGDRVRKCKDGYWGGKAPSCKKKYYEPKRCKYLDDPDYGYVKTNGREVGCVANYYCHDGYKLYGNSVRKCLYNGYWSGDKPKCKRLNKGCPRLRDPYYGKVWHYGKRYGYSYAHGSTANYKCDYGYYLHGHSKRVCRNGYWSGKSPRCVKQSYGKY